MKLGMHYVEKSMLRLGNKIFSLLTMYEQKNPDILSSSYTLRGYSEASSLIAALSASDLPEKPTSYSIELC
jgi:hypothetical protein